MRPFTMGRGKNKNSSVITTTTAAPGGTTESIVFGLEDPNGTVVGTQSYTFTTAPFTRIFSTKKFTGDGYLQIRDTAMADEGYFQIRDDVGNEWEIEDRNSENSWYCYYTPNGGSAVQVATGALNIFGKFLFLERTGNIITAKYSTTEAGARTTLHTFSQAVPAGGGMYLKYTGGSALPQAVADAKISGVTVVDIPGGTTTTTTTLAPTTTTTTTVQGACTNLTGTMFFQGGNYAGNPMTQDKVFDGDIATYWDSTQADGAYIGLNLAGPAQIATIKFAPRQGFPGRMVGGKFQASNTSSSAGFVDLYTISTPPAEGILTTITLNTQTSYSWIRYIAPSLGYGNIAEMQICGYYTGATTTSTSTTTTTTTGPSTTTTTTIAGSEPSITQDVDVDPQTFGVSPNNTDNSTQLYNMTAAYKGIGKPIPRFLFPLAWNGLTIKYTNNGWFDQMDKYIIEGQGASGINLLCTSNDGNDVARQATNNSGALLNYPSGNVFPYTIGGKKFNTAAAGTTTITLQEGSGVFSIGDEVILAGYEDQVNGYPMNARFVEYNKIIGGSYPTFTMQNPLKYTYNQDWRDFAKVAPLAVYGDKPMSPYTADPNHGKPRMWPLKQTSTGSPKGYTSYAWFRNCNFPRNPNSGSASDPVGSEGNRRWKTTHPVRIIADVLRMTNCNAEDIWTSENNYVLMEGGSYAFAEFDKYNDRVRCVGVNFPGTWTNNNSPGGIGGATGVNRLELINCTLGNYCFMSPNVLYAEGCAFTSRDGNPNVFPHPENTWWDKWEFKNCTFKADATGGAHVMWSYSNGGFTSNGGSATTVTFDGGSGNTVNNLGTYKNFGPGPVKTSNGAITAICTDITYSAPNFVAHLTNVVGGTPASGQSWQFNRSGKIIDSGGNVSLSGKPLFG